MMVKLKRCINLFPSCPKREIYNSFIPHSFLNIKLLQFTQHRSIDLLLLYIRPSDNTIYSPSCEEQSSLTPEWQTNSTTSKSTAQAQQPQ